MTVKIERDQRRFKQIVKGKVRQNLKQFVTQGEMIGRKGKDLVSIPLPQLDLPRFRFGDNGAGGVASGEGEEGQPVGKGGQPQPGQGQAGSDPGDGHLMEVDISLEELAELLGAELELPRIEPRGAASITQQKNKYDTVRHVGPEALRHKKRTYLQALKRQISTGEYRPDDPRIIPIKGDKRYKSWTTIDQPQVNAAVFYLMDVSGSMTDEQKQIVRTEAFWIDAWLASQYDGIETRYIIHDAVAKEVDEHTFYHTRESGGTRISSAYKVCADLIKNHFPPADWNLYVFQFSDGDNWGEDNQQALSILSDSILPAVNLYCYGQVESPYGSGEYLNQLESRFGELDQMVLSEIPDREAIYESIRAFLGKGR
ncbi:hypothetical protein Pla175_33540 [Pirellulimonas nuda]|uniref:DUF444 family protein n=1 Tax=Pirellulimonas nuda TaxID=2528009 RepID=A0A518DEQ7_9BACT|nr:DUF444 family protein [Pirellulimonas nuda]QDU89957.1 hypothetical protein Pla175_33540 [Pirellulimonas nuda]